MKKMMLLASVVALVALALAAAPAFANHGERVSICHFPPGNPENVQFITISEHALDTHIDRHGDFVAETAAECEGAEPGPIKPPDRDDGRDGRDGRDGDRFFDFDEPFISQDIEQEAESGDVDQSFTVTNTGDNSNQCVGVQGVANTGNAQNVTGVSQFDNGFGFDTFDDGHFFRDFGGDGFGDFEIEDSGASIEVSPSNTTTCDQQVNQAASASGPTHYWW